MGLQNNSIEDYINQIEGILDERNCDSKSNVNQTDRERIQSLLNEMRLNIPLEIHQAKSIINQYDDIIKKAETKAHELQIKAQTDKNTAESKNNFMLSLSKLIYVMMRYYSDVRFSEHALKVYAYASNIGESEGLPENEKFILSTAAILHDIGIPQAIKLYGSAKGELQEKEGALLVPELLCQADIQNEITDRVAWLVGHHHTEALADNDLLLQILMEADYLVNLAEGNLPGEKAQEVKEKFFKTNTGIGYITALFKL